MVTRQEIEDLRREIDALTAAGHSGQARMKGRKLAEKLAEMERNQAKGRHKYGVPVLKPRKP